MLYFFGWVAFILAIFLAIPVGIWLDKRRMTVKDVVETEEEEEVVLHLEEQEEVEVEAETELEKRIRRMRIISENMTQEEMFAHAQATLELATMLQAENRFEDADNALESLTSQPGIGNHYRVRALAKHGVVLRELGRTDEYADSQAVLHEVYENMKTDEPEDAVAVIEELTAEEAELLSIA